MAIEFVEAVEECVAWVGIDVAALAAGSAVF